MIKVDKARGGLSDYGQWYFGREIRETLTPIVKEIAEDGEVSEMAERYKQENAEYLTGGTCAITLDVDERRNLFDLIGEQSGLDMHGDYVLKLMSTSVVI